MEKQETIKLSNFYHRNFHKVSRIKKWYMELDKESQRLVRYYAVRVMQDEYGLSKRGSYMNMEEFKEGDIKSLRTNILRTAIILSFLKDQFDLKFGVIFKKYKQYLELTGLNNKIKLE